MRAACIAFITVFILVSCNGYVNRPIVSPDVILKNTRNFYAYWHKYLNIEEIREPLDSNGNRISTEVFFSLVSEGKYFPVKLSSQYKPQYMLCRVPPSTDELIISWIKKIGSNGLKCTNSQGKPMPAIEYKSLSDKVYNRNTTKGKILVINFWFIHCAPCVAEIPELNGIVQEFSTRDDIVFLAISFDSGDDLHTFLTKTDFKYDLISDTANFLAKQFQISSYPSHVVIDKDGNVANILTDQFHNMENLKRILNQL